MKLTLTVDDFGPRTLVAERTFELYALGLVSRVSVLVNLPWPEGILERLKSLAVPTGLHLNMTSGVPLAGQPLSLDLGVSELEKEWQAQHEKFLAMGLTLAHVDNHRPEIYFAPEHFIRVMDLAETWQVPLRYPLSGFDAKDCQIQAVRMQRSESEISRLKQIYDRAWQTRKLPVAPRFYVDSAPEGLPAIFSELQERSEAEVEIAVHLDRDESYEFLKTRPSGPYTIVRQ